jgi:hypothetical protein
MHGGPTIASPRSTCRAVERRAVIERRRMTPAFAVNPHGAELVQVCNDPPVYRNRKRFPGGKDMPSTVIFRLDAPLFFANFESVGDRIRIM